MDYGNRFLVAEKNLCTINKLSFLLFEQEFRLLYNRCIFEPYSVREINVSFIITLKNNHFESFRNYRMFIKK